MNGAEPIACRQRIAASAKRAAESAVANNRYLGTAAPPPCKCPFPLESAAGMAWQAAFTRFCHVLVADECMEGGA